MNWLKRTSWPEELKQFIAEIGCDPLAANNTDGNGVDSQQLNQLARQYALPAERPAFRSALYLAANELDASHELSQEIHTGIGSYLHGIMHRREKDFSNANYWFHRATTVSIFESIENLLSDTTVSWVRKRGASTPWRFDPVELTKWHRMAVEASFGSETETQSACEAVNDLAWQEWSCVFDTLIVAGK